MTPPQPLKETLDHLQQIRVDAIHGKKKHFNAADRKEHLQGWFQIPPIILNLVTAGTIAKVFQDANPDNYKWVAAILPLIAASLTGVAALLAYPKKIEGHRRVGNKYLEIAKRAKKARAYFDDGIIKQADLIKHIDKLAKDIADVNQEATAFPPSNKDFQKSREGIDEGEEHYSDVDMTL